MIAKAWAADVPAEGGPDATAGIALLTAAAESWLKKNQRVLGAEFKRIAALLDAAGSAATADAAAADRIAAATADAAAARADLEDSAAIDRLVEIFGLTPFERNVVLLCAAIEMDGAVAQRSAALTGGPWATFALSLAALPDAHWTALLPDGPLRRFRLVEVPADRWHTTDPIALPESVVHFLAGIEMFDPTVAPLLRAVAAPPVMVASQGAAARTAIAYLERSASTAIIHLFGDDHDGQEDVAAAAVAAIGLTLRAIHVDNVSTAATDRARLAADLSRDAALTASALLVDVGAGPIDPWLDGFVASLQSIVFVSTHGPILVRPADLRIEVNRPRRAELAELLAATSGSAHAAPGSIRLPIAGPGPASVRSTLALVRSMSDPEEADNTASRRTRRVASPAAPAVEGIWRRDETAAGWADLVLPDAQFEALRAIAAQVKVAPTVYERWGFAAGGRGLGVTALFAGESGTGKTLAAEVLANELAVELYRVDLSAVVSKYIGDTEKSLRRVFDAAEASGALLLFDESDALFGKRSDIRDSHDRYANIEVSYLLQQMEAYRGLAILTTNMKSGLDRAFLRRLRFVVQFSFPDALLRERIWRSVFPAEAPTRRLDYGRLAQLNVTGGGIRNIALNAAFLAADEGRPITMRHLVRAATAEAAKRERLLTAAEAKGWAEG